MTSWKAVAMLATIVPNAVFGSEHSGKKPKQGVFLLSNQIENEVGVYESLPDGALSWVGAYKTNGIGYPENEELQDNLDALGSSNPVSYFVWDDKQWLAVSNAGGPTGDASISLMEVNPVTLELSVTAVAPLNGIFTCSVATYEDRVCAVTCAGSVTMECFRITSSDDNYQMEFEYIHDFGANIPPVEGRPNATSAVYGPGNILFSGDGKQVGILMKGDSFLGVETLEETESFSAPKAGLHVFPVTEEGYMTPAFHALPDDSLPFAFTWRSGMLDTNKQIAIVVSIAGENNDILTCDGEDGPRCRSSITSILSDFDSDSSIVLTKVDEINADQVDLCWVDYRFGHFYTGNFFSDSVTIGSISRAGMLTVERNSPVGRGTIPNDIAHMGRKMDGSFYLYTENQGTAEVGVHRVVENEYSSFQLEVMVGAPYPDGITGDAWIGSHGIATTLLSEEELFDMYGYEHDHHSESGAAAVHGATYLIGGLSYLIISMML